MKSQLTIPVEPRCLLVIAQMTTLLESPITASVPKYMVDALGFSKSTRLQTVCTAILLIFFIKGVVHHSFGFAGINPGGHSELWHGFNMFMCEVAIFAIFSQRELGWFWLLALFVCEIPIELTGTFRSYGSDLFADQLVEVVIDTICLACVVATRQRYARK